MASTPRRFTLIISKGSANGQDYRLPLIDSNIFASNPTGLGVEFDTTYTFPDNMANSYIEDSRTVKQTPLTFSLILGVQPSGIQVYETDPYKIYAQTVDMLDRGLIELEYKYGDTTLLRKVQVQSLSKTELDSATGLMVSSIALTPLSLWYEWVKIEDQFVTPERPTGSISVNNDSIYMGGQRVSPLRVILSATDRDFVNPTWTARGTYNGKAITLRESFNFTLPQGQRLTVDSDPFNQRMTISRISNGGSVSTNFSEIISTNSDVFIGFPTSNQNTKSSLGFIADTVSVAVFGTEYIEAWYKRELVSL